MNAAVQSTTPTSGAQDVRRPRGGAYVVAVLLTGAALAVALPLDAAVERASLMVFVAGVAAACTVGGLRPGIAATILSLAAIDYFLLDPRLSLVVDGEEVLVLAVFNAVALGVCGLIHSAHAGRSSRSARDAFGPGVARRPYAPEIASAPTSPIDARKAPSARSAAAASDEADVPFEWRTLWGMMLVLIAACLGGFVGFSVGLFSAGAEYRWGLLLAAAFFAVFPFTVRGSLRGRRRR